MVLQLVVQVAPWVQLLIALFPAAPPVALVPPVIVEPPAALVPPAAFVPPVIVEPPAALVPPVPWVPLVVTDPPVALLPPETAAPPLPDVPPTPIAPPVADIPPEPPSGSVGGTRLSVALQPMNVSKLENRYRNEKISPSKHVHLDLLTIPDSIDPHLESTTRIR